MFLFVAKYVDAIEDVKELMVHMPGDAFAKLLLSKYLYSSGSHKEAKTMIEEATHMNFREFGEDLNYQVCM